MRIRQSCAVAVATVATLYVMTPAEEPERRDGGVVVRLVHPHEVKNANATVISQEQEEEGDLSAWIITNLGEEPDAVADDESDLIPVKWEHGLGFVKRG